MNNPQFEDSYGRLFGPNVSMDAQSDAFFASFYDRFLKAPGVAELFAGTDMTRQVQMLKRSLFQLVSFYVSGEPSAELARLSALHGNLGISKDMFDAWLDALTATVLEHDEQADEATRLAWCWALAPGITYMRMGLHAKV
jgi:truncated hemoglobin YjbI